MPRRRYALLWLALPTLALSPALGACHHGRSSIVVPEQPKTTLRVSNEEFLDAVIYVVNNGQPVRLGIASSNRTTTFEIPKHLIFGATPLSFQVHPIGANTRPSTGDMMIDPGDDLDLQLSGGRLVLTRR
jgi:hypothetical protein